MREAYGQIIESFYWACLVNKNMIIDGVDRDQILQSIHDPKCKAWKLKLNGKKTVNPTPLVDDLPITQQMASQMVSMKLQEVFKMVEEEVTTKSPQQIKMIKDTIQSICTSQALVHRHAADLADYLVSLLIMIKVMNAMMRLVVAVRIPEVDKMVKKAQAKVEVIQKAKEATARARPIDKVIFIQNCPMYNGMGYIASLVCRYMDELM